MDIKQAIQRLDDEWDENAGFFGKLRAGIVDKEGLQRVRETLEAVDTSNEQTLDKQFVSLTWFIPTYMGWQRERVREKGGDVDGFDHATHLMVELLFRVLGVP
jgi:phospholipase C